MVFKKNNIPKESVDKGVIRQIIANDPELMMVWVEFKKGSLGPPHSHPHRQASYVVKGKFELDINGEKSILEKGDSFFIPPNVEHGAVALEDGELIDVFTPAREDFIAKD